MCNVYTAQGIRFILEVADCAGFPICGEAAFIDIVSINMSIPVGTSSPRQVYIGHAGIAQFGVSYEVRCTGSFYGGDCATFCVNFESCEECGLPGFTGEFCQIDIDDCEDEDCSGNGRCEDRLNGFTCVCEAGYTGEHCQTNIDDCGDEDCSGNGRC